MHSSTHRSIHLSMEIHPSSVYLSTYRFINQFIYLSIYLSSRPQSILPSTSPLAAFLSPSATPPSTSGSRVHCVRLWGSTEVQTALASCLSEVTRTQSSRHRHRGSVGSIDAQYSLEEALHGRGGWEGSKDPGHLTVPPDGHSTAGVGTPHSTWTPRFPTSRK